MLKHERYCGKWDKRWLLWWPAQMWWVSGDRSTSALLQPPGTFWQREPSSLCTSVGGRQPIPLHCVQGESGRAVVTEILPGCRKAEGTHRSSPQLEELAFGTALCPSLWKTWMQINDKVKGWVNPSRVESCASLRSGCAKAAACAEGRLCSVQQWPFLAGSSSEGTALPV